MSGSAKGIQNDHRFSNVLCMRLPHRHFGTRNAVLRSGRVELDPANVFSDRRGLGVSRPRDKIESVHQL